MMEKGYDAAYYQEYDIGSKTVNYLESPELRAFHASVAREITARFQPKTMLDAGCAMGVLVSEFIKQGVKAYGIDMSEYAVANGDILARETCFQGSLADPFPMELPERFDLVTCMEVVEHMPPEDSRKAIANLCRVTDTVIFCSSPDDYEDPTHINIQEREYWAACFAENGFFDDLDHRPLFMAPYAVCYRKSADWMEQVKRYERYVRNTDAQLVDFRDAHYKALEREHEKAVAEWTRTANDLNQMNLSYLQLKGEYDGKMAQLLRALEDGSALREQQLQSQQREAEIVRTAHEAELARVQLQQQYELLQETEKKLRLQLQGKDAELTQKLHEKEMQILEIETVVKSKEQRIAQAEADFGNLKNELDDVSAKYTALAGVYHDTREALDHKQLRIEALESSLSWRITAPLRGIKLGIKRLIGRSARILFRTAQKSLGSKPVRLALRVTRKLRRKTSTLGADAANWPPQVRKSVTANSAENVEKNCKRLGIYTIYDKDGVVDEYVIYFLRALSAWVETLIVVSNGPLEDSGTQLLEALGCQILIRENKGFDAWGVKAGIDHMGFEALKKYDEVVIANNTLFGPVGGLEAMFTEMSQRKLDFWGITSHSGMPDMDPFGCNPYGYIPEHIQSFFYCIRQRMLGSEAFRRFWTDLPSLPDYNAAVGLYETVMTKYFSDAGFVWETYMDPKAYYDMTDNPLVAMPMESIRDWNCPVFKRRAFFQDMDYLTTYTGQQSAAVLLQYLQENTDYPVEYVWKNLIRTCHMSDLTQDMHLSMIFDRDNAYGVIPGIQMPKAALFMHIYDHTMGGQLASYAASLPPEADIYISTVSEDRKAAIAQAFSQLPNRVEIRVLPNRGRDVSALLTSFRDVVMNYDVACVTHDKKTGYLKPQTVGEGFAYMGYENILGSRIFVDQVLQSFVTNPFLGLLYAPDPNHADFAPHIGLEWGQNFDCTKELAQDLGLHVPMDAAHQPMAPFGSSFWFRTKAMAPLFAKEWTYEDFPKEPFHMTDGSILHAIERIYPYVAQHAGYYSALLMTADYASLEISNLTYYAQQYTHACFETGVAGRFITVRNYCNSFLGPVIPGVDVAQAQSMGKTTQFFLRLRTTLSRWANE